MSGARPCCAVLLVATVVGGFLPGRAEAGFTVEVVNLDGPGEGLNSNAAWTPRSGNAATTLGAARLNAVEFALQVWSQQLDSDVPIRVGVSFDPIAGSSPITLGIGGPDGLFRDFAGAPRAGTWYASALADKLAGMDLDPGELDLRVQFNSDVDGPAVFGNDSFDYGLGDLGSASDIWFLPVALHEIAHGLGFVTGVSRVSGAKLLGYDDALMAHLVRFGATPAAFPDMSNSQRLSAMTAGPELQWSGAGIATATGLLTAGWTPAGNVEMYAPTTGISGSAMSHFSTTLAPPQIMGPYYLESGLEFRVTRAALWDLGWGQPASCN